MELNQVTYNDMPTYPITALSLMTSCGCNLNCEYCVINKSYKNNPSAAHQIQKNTIAALEDGTFLENVQKSILAMGGFPNNIDCIELWGQEQTLTLEHFYNHIQDWIDAFPNWEIFSFSTNGQAFPEKIVQLIVELDKHLDRNMNFSLQWSYDGDYSGAELRHDTDNKVIKNLTTVIESLNEIKLNHVDVRFHLHGVVSFALIEHLGGDINKIKEYWDGCEEVARYLPTLIRNNKVSMDASFSTADEAPYSTSVQEAFAFVDFYRKSAILGYDTNGLSYFSGQWIRAMRRQFPETEGFSLSEMIDWIYGNMHNEEMRLEINRRLSSFFFCGSVVGELKVMYDGTLVNCQNSIFETDPDDISPDEDLIVRGAKMTWAKKGFYLNPITASEHEKEKLKYIFSAGRSSTFWHMFNTNITQLHFLAISGQIDPIYAKDFQLLIEHAFICTYLNQCYYNNAIRTGSMWLKDTGSLRKCCNGVAMQTEMFEINSMNNGERS